MAHEIELKLLTPPAASARVVRLPWLRALARGPAERQRLVTVYFDTAKLKLRGHGVAIRIRHAGKRRLQTVKTATRGAGGAFGRQEWEREIRGDTPDLTLAQDTALGPLATKTLQRKLKPVFETLIDRTTLPIRSGGADLELAIDRGHIRTHGGKREAVCEIEIELKRGDPAELARIARRLARSVPLAYGPRSKAERGYALGTGEARGAIHAASIELRPKLSTAEAFQVIGLACLDHALSNDRAARAGEAEGIHQMRVGLRRLRAAISVFKEMVQGTAEAEAVKTELKWLTRQLSPARDFDVLIEERVRPLRKKAPIAAEAGILEQKLDASRNAGREQAKSALESKRYRATGLHTALWLADGAWRQNNDALSAARRARPAAEFAAEALAKRARKIVKKARRVDTLDVRARHKLRIAIKKLRYACEFFSSLYPGGKRQARLKRFSKTLKSMQSSLGTLHDMKVHEGLAAKIARSRRQNRSRAPEALAMGFITGQEQKQAAFCLAQIDEATRRLSRLRPFWTRRGHVREGSPSIGLPSRR